MFLSSQTLFCLIEKEQQSDSASHSPHIGFVPLVTSNLSNLRQYFAAFPPNLRGSLWFLAAMLGFSVAVVLIKMLGQQLHVTQIVALRQIIIILALVPAILKASPEERCLKRPGLQAIRAGLVSLAILAGFTAIIQLPLATATTLSFARTFFATIFAILILKESVGPYRISALLVGFAGILVIMRPDAGSLWNIDMLLAIAAAAGVAVNTTLIRIQSQEDKPSMMVAYQALLVGLAMSPLAYIFWQPPTSSELMLILVVGLLTVCAQWAMVHAYKAAEASALAPLDYLRLLLMTLLGWLVFNEWPDPRTWVGAAIILASALFILYREGKRKRQADNRLSSG